MPRSKAIQCKHLPDGVCLQRVQQYQGACAQVPLFAWIEMGAIPFPTDTLIAEGWPEGVVYAKWERLVNRGLLEWGVSIRSCYLTDAGEAALVRYLVGVVRAERG